ncbi:MAG: hypothetical protein ONB44_02705 [candidate division KSB1 bacterium]|nr:hypothetical protein [candidate division KSB1 bacterium]MDZ7301035.1 hypothetical protein [candidate division KSB1 bacterium]MDZ7310287.1 hypothetical protein [candidate division KSB1 bacterium]
MPNAITIKAPSWVAEDDFLSLLRQDLQLKLAYYESQCRMLERKYQKTFAEFEAALHADEQENFQKWEDYMDWETAESARQECEQRLRELVTWKT